MKKIAAVLTTGILTLSSAGCAHKNMEEPSIPQDPGIEQEDVMDTHNDAVEGKTSTGTQSEQIENQETEEEEMAVYTITAGDREFSVLFYDNETARAFMAQLPVTLDMSEMNGNEKYCYLSESLPTDPARPGQIHTGELMLYGSDCIVLFYETFSTAYSYTPIGYVEDPEGLADALGSGSVSVTFKI